MNMATISIRNSDDAQSSIGLFGVVHLHRYILNLETE